MNQSSSIQLKAITIAKTVLRMTTRAGSGHPSSALSLLHLVTVLMYRVLRFDYRNPWNRGSDRLVLSEGHAVPVVYAAYADLNGAYGIDDDNKEFFAADDVDTLRQINSPFDGHPNPRTGIPFFDCATGSLGQGLSCACGLALAARLDDIKKNVYVLIGDGESREGQIWEACDFLVDYNLTNVIPIFNCNGLGQSDPVSPQQSAERIAAKLEAFGFYLQIIDGHDPEAITEAIYNAHQSRTPGAIIAKTVKGWGVPALQGTGNHGKPLKRDQLPDAYTALESLLPQQDTEHHYRAPDSFSLPKAELHHEAPGKLHDPDFSALLADDSHLEVFKQGKLSTRRAYGLALCELAKIDSRVVGIDGDVKNSTYAEYLAKALPSRFFEARIAEQNMISVAAGLAVSGKIPFVSSFAKFLVRGYDQLELALISGAPVKLCGSHAGANIGADGPSQMGLTDMAYMRGLSTACDDDGTALMTIFNPACAVAAYKCVQIMADHRGACYMRTIREDLPILYPPSQEFPIGGSHLLREGSDVAIMASGYMVHFCLRAIDQMRKAGIEASLYDCYSLPLNPATVYSAARDNNGKILTLEDNYGNGLGAEIASIVSANPEVHAIVKQLFVQRIPKSGLTAGDVLNYVGLGI